MMRTFVITVALGVFLTACSDAQFVVQETARNTAKSVVNTVVGQRFPGVNAAPITDCVIDHASNEEILNIATGAITGPDEATIQIVLNIAGRPETTQCITQNVLAAQLG